MFQSSALVLRRGNFLLRGPFASSSSALITTASRFKSGNSNKAPSLTSDEALRNLKERSQAVFKNFFSLPSIEEYIHKQSVRLTPTIMLYSGRNVDQNYLIKSAQYVQKEMPIRISHRIADMRNLPFIVASSPALIAVHDLYVRAFEKLWAFKPIETAEDDRNYCHMLRALLHDHRNVVTYLAEGFDETGHYIKDKEMIRQFLDAMLTSRLGIRMLAEHHISLHEERPNHVGIINLKFSPRKLIEAKAEEARELCEHEYGVAPAVKLTGHTEAIFPYISQPLDYIVYELLKNAFRASVEAHYKTAQPTSPAQHFIDDDSSITAASQGLPPVKVSIVSNDVDFMIRISDRGGGIPHTYEERVWEYLFTTGGRTVKHLKDSQFGIGALSATGSHAAGPVGGPMHGFGFGLPASRAYAKYLGGSLNLQTLPGLGTDVYLRLRHIDGRLESFRI